MKKKIKPAEQTEELNRAKLEFLKRNGKKIAELLKSLPVTDARTGEFIDMIGDFFEKNNIPTEDRDEILADALGGPAVKDFLWAQIGAHSAAVRRWGESLNMSPEEINAWERKGAEPTVFPERFDEFYLEGLLADSKEIIKDLMRERPRQHIIVSIDLTRSTDVITEEIRAIVTSETRQRPSSRLKWLPKTDELLEVWDLYDQAGQQPGKLTFRQISKTVGRPLSTVKGQWRAAYEKIYDEPYNPETKYATEEKRGDATQLCAKCPHGAKCYRGNDWFPCQDYLKIAGMDKNPPMTEYRENIPYKNKDIFLED